MKIDMNDRVALVTGGAVGIGEASAFAFAGAGAAVVVADVKDEQGELVCGRIREDGGRAHYIHCDVADVDQVESMIGETVAKFGRLDFAFNNAGSRVSLGSLRSARSRTLIGSWG